MTIQVVIEEEGAQKAAYDLERVALRAEDLLPVWPELNAIFHRDEESRFAMHGSPPWEKLADATLENKARLGQPPEIMRGSETLKRSLTSGSRGAEESVRPGRVVFGTDVPYARFHEYGTRNMPRRVVAAISPAAGRRMTQVVSRYITEGLP